MKRIFLIITLIVINIPFTKSQEVLVNADFVSSYMWRGMKNGNASIQPSIGFNIGGFTISAWGSSEFNNSNNALDLSLEYEVENWLFTFTDYFTQDEDDSFDYFNYKAHTTGHCFDAGVTYTFEDRFPLSISWFTMVAGDDFKENGKRAWSSYIELSYPIYIRGIELSFELGITPWEGMYADKFNVNNIAINASKELQISSKFALNLFTQLGFNPVENKTYFVAGFGF